MGLGGGHGPAGGTWPCARGSGTGPASTGPPPTTQEQVESGCVDKLQGQGWGQGQGRDRCWAGGEAQSHPTALLFQLLWPPHPISTLRVPRFPHPWGPLLAAGRAEGAAWCRIAGLRLSRPRLSHGRGPGQLPLLTVAKFSAGRSQDPPGSLSWAHPIHQGGSSTQG